MKAPGRRVVVIDDDDVWAAVEASLAQGGLALEPCAEAPPSLVRDDDDTGFFRCRLAAAVTGGPAGGEASPTLGLGADPTLAAGVAHEVNNPLTAIIANLDLALRALETEDAAAPSGVRDSEAAVPVLGSQELGRLRTELRDAHEAAVHVRKIVQAVRALSLPNEEALEIVDVCAVIDKAARLATCEITSRARLRKDCARLPPVRSTAARLEQVFLNLLMNAAQAITPGAPDRHEILVAARVDDLGWVNVTVTDDGGGIAPEHLSRVFVPFFTTKSAGGTGLGLPISQRIVASLGGRIQIASELGRGTTVTVSLPPASADE